jgi:hypothetical protein
LLLQFAAISDVPGESAMRKHWVRFVVASIVLVSLVGIAVRSSFAVPEFEAEFKALYYRPNHNAKAKAFADAIDAISTEMPSPRGTRVVACNVCHVDGQHKRERNDYGQALDKLLDRRAHSKNKQQIQAALKKVAAMKKEGTGPTYFELIGKGKLPGEPVE